MSHPFIILRALLIGALFLSLQTWFLPRWVGIRGRWDAAVGEPWRLLGIVPMVFGAAVMLACVWRFGTIGEGTPAPFDPPRRALFAERASLTRIGWYGLALATITACFVHFYEEPTLRRKFGGEYEAYCRKVKRWIPTLRA